MLLKQSNRKFNKGVHMFGKATGTQTKDAMVKPAGSIPTAGRDMKGDYLAENKAIAASNVAKINRSKIKKEMQ